MTSNSQQTLAGVYPVLPTPFHAAGQAGQAALRTLDRYLIGSGVDELDQQDVDAFMADLADLPLTKPQIQALCHPLKGSHGTA